MTNTLIKLPQCIIKAENSLNIKYSSLFRDKEGNLFIITSSRNNKTIFVMLYGCSYFDKNIDFELMPVQNIEKIIDDMDCRTFVQFDCMDHSVKQKLCGDRFISLYESRNPLHNEKVSANELIDYVNLGIILFYENI